MARSRTVRGSQSGFHPRGPTGWDLRMSDTGRLNSEVRWLLIAIVILILLTPPAVIFRDTLIRTFGLAMGPVGGVALLSIIVAARHPKSLVSKFNWWLAVVVAGAITFGSMAFFSFEYGVLRDVTMGGEAGVLIIGEQDRWGIARLSGMALLACYLVAPRFSLQTTLIALFSVLWSITLIFRVMFAAFGKIRDRYEDRQVRRMVGSLNRVNPNRVNVSEMWPRLGMIRPRESQPIEAPPPEELNYEAAIADSLVMAEPVPAPTGVAVADIDENKEYEEEEVEYEDQEPEDDEPLRPVYLPKQEPMFTDPVPAEPQPTNGLSGAHAAGIGPAVPSLDILDATEQVETHPDDHKERAQQIEEALASHGIDAKVTQINPGPTVTQFGVEPGWFRKFKEVRERDPDGKLKVDQTGQPVVRRQEVSKKRVRVDQIAALDKDLALAMAAPTIRIEAPVPGKAMVGIEVPNVTMGVVGLKEALASPEFRKMLGKSKLAVALGKGSAGQMLMGDLAAMPHLLIAGSTGSGKSVCITSLISSLLMNNTPRDVQFVMVDPKRVELVPFSTVPHLATPVIMDMDKVVGALKWVTEEMDRRYKVMAGAGARNIGGYNAKVDEEDHMSYLVVVIDELADLMVMAPFDVEQSLTRLAQMGRATGIHLIVATQRPSVDVITGLIKANFPTRISFAVTSMTDSRVILDAPGAEKLLGRGDMLYLPSDAAKPKRLQGVYLSDMEVERIVHFWSEKVGGVAEPPTIEELLASGSDKEQNEFEEPSLTLPLLPRISDTLQEILENEDPMFTKARGLAMRHKSVSASLLQRRLGIGYPKAASLLDQLEENGLVSAGEPGKSRTVLKPDEDDDDY